MDFTLSTREHRAAVEAAADALPRRTGIWRTTPVDACYRLAAALTGAPLPAAHPPPRTAHEPGPRERVLDALRKRWSMLSGGNCWRAEEAD